MKRLVLLFSFLVISFSSFAQFEYGVKAFVNASNVGGGMYQTLFPENSVPKIGYGFGIYGEFKNLMAPRVGLKGEILLNTIGERVKFNNNLSQNIRLTYINIPILAEYKVANDKLTFAAGPQFGFCLGAKQISRNGANAETIKYQNSYYNPVDFSFAFGVSYLVWDKLGVEARHNIGLTNVYKNSNDPIGKNNFFTLGVIYGF